MSKHLYRITITSHGLTRYKFGDRQFVIRSLRAHSPRRTGSRYPRIEIHRVPEEAFEDVTSEFIVEDR